MKREKVKIGKIGKKAQVTIFMIVGIVLIIGASLLFYSNSKKADNVASASTLKADDVESYIKTCLKDSLKNNLVMLGLQGGRLYTSQNGLFPDFMPVQRGFFYILSDEGKVPFLIDKPYGKEAPRGDGESYDSNTPVYPWVNFPYRQGVKTYTGYFGINRMPPLKRPQNYSIEEEIESAVLADIKACDLTSFQNKYEIDAKAPSLKIRFDKSVIAELEYPITIKEHNTGAKKEFRDFKESLPVKLDGIFTFVASIIQKDVQNMTYDITSEQTKDYIVAIKRSAFGFDDLITITDKNSKIDNKPYKFQFARKNRIPALEKIDTPKISITVGHKILDDVRSKIIAIDPDEDNLTINANGIPDDRILADCNPTTLPGFRVNVTDGQYQDYADYSIMNGNLELICS